MVIPLYILLSVSIVLPGFMGFKVRSECLSRPNIPTVPFIFYDFIYCTGIPHILTQLGFSSVQCQQVGNLCGRPSIEVQIVDNLHRFRFVRIDDQLPILIHIIAQQLRR